MAEITPDWRKNLRNMMLFGILAFLFSKVSYTIPGFALSTDLREIFAIISVAFLSHWLYAAGVGLITALAGPYTDMVMLNFIGHLLFIPAYWFIFKFENQRIQNNWIFAIAWVVTVFLMYTALFLIMVMGNILKGGSLELAASNFILLYHAFKMEAFFTAAISALSLILIRVDRAAKCSLEHLVKERTAQLERATEELVQKEKLSVLGQITASVSHDLRNPLATIRGTLFSVRDAMNKNQTDRADHALKLADRNVVRCDNILEDLLNFTKKRNIRLEHVNLGNWLNRLLDEQVAFEHVKFQREFSQGPDVQIDQEQMRRAVINVLTNAIQSYNDLVERDKIVYVDIAKSDGDVQIIIRDAGEGISPEALEKIFEPLFSTKNYGIGLGLPIVKDILEEHGGGISIKSKKNKGSTVTLWLPETKV